MKRNILNDSGMNPTELDRILASEQPLIPSSGFLASVMESVAEEAAAPRRCVHRLTRLRASAHSVPLEADCPRRCACRGDRLLGRSQPLPPRNSSCRADHDGGAASPRGRNSTGRTSGLGGSGSWNLAAFLAGVAAVGRALRIAISGSHYERECLMPNRPSFSRVTAACPESMASAPSATPSFRSTARPAATSAAAAFNRTISRRAPGIPVITS